MASALALTTTFAVVLCGCLAADYGWQGQKELMFSLQGQDLVGLPQLKPQYAGFRYEGELRVQTHTPRVLLLKFFNMSYSKIHDEFPRGWWRGPEASAKDKRKPLTITTSTIVVKLRRTMTPEVIMQAGLDEWQVNFIKGVVSHLMVYLKDNSPSGHSNNKLFSSRTRDVYSVFEDSVSGRCEVMYEISPMPRQVAPANHRLCGSDRPLWEITKTRNFSNCQILSEDHAHLPTSQCTPGGSNCGRFWTRASLTQMVGCGELHNFVLLSSVSSSIKNAQLHLKNNSQAVVNSNLNITLTSVLALKSKFNAPQDKEFAHNLLYSYSPTPKGLSSRKCQDTLNYSEEDKDSHEHVDSNKQINPTKGEDKKNVNSVGQSKAQFRRRRGAEKYSRYRLSSELQSNENDETSSNNNFNRNNIGKTKKKKRVFNVESDEGSNDRTNDNSNNKFISEEKNYNRQGKQNNNDRSDESNVQQSQETNNRQGKQNKNYRSDESDDQKSEETNNRQGKQNKNYQSDESDDQRSEETNNRQGKQNKNYRSDESDDQQSEETNNQNFEEMDLEDLWKISGRDTKKFPPHRPFNFFALAHRRTYDSPCLKAKLRQIIGDIASDLKEINMLPEKNTMDKLSIAVDICRSLPLDQLSAISEEIFESHNGASNAMKDDQRKVFRDVITMCGSHPAFQVIKGWVERKQVEGEEAAQIIASLPSHIFSPNKNLIQDFFEMVQRVAEKEDHQLTTTAVLALSNLVRSACVNRASRQRQFSSIVKPVCEEELVSRYVDWLSHKISSDAPVRRAYIEALGNVGSPHVIDILNSIAVNPNYSSYFRTSAIFAMRYQALRKNPEMAPLLMSLYHNYSMPASARIASAALLVYAEPGLAIWQRLAISTWYEPSSAVSQYVSSSIRNFARAKDTLYGHITKAAALVQPLAKPSKIRANRPLNLVSSWLSSDLEKLILEQTSWMMFNDYSNFYYRHSSRYSGFSRANIEASISLSNPDELWGALQDAIVPDVDNTTPLSRGVGHTLDDIQNTLNLHTQTMPALQAELHLKINNMFERMILMNRDTVESLAKGGRGLVLDVIRQGKKFSYQKSDMDSFHVSTTTEMGFPVQLSVRTPWVVKTKAKLNTTMEGVNLEAAFMYSAQMLSSMTVMSPWDNVAHMAGAYATNFVQLPPLQMTARFDRDSNSVKMTTSNIEQHRLLYFNMQPFTSQRKINVHQPALLSPDTRSIKLGESVQMPISGMGRFLNTVYSSERSGHFNALDLVRQARGVVGFPMVFADMEAQSFETVINPLHPITINFSMSMASKSKGVLESNPLKATYIGRILSSLERVASIGQRPVIAAFRIFGGLFGGSEDSTTTTTTTTTTTQSPPADNSQSNNKDSDNNGPDDNSKTKNSKSEEDGNDEASKDGNRRKTDGQKPDDQSMGNSTPSTEIYSTTYESAVGSFNASQIDPFKSSDPSSGASYLLDQVLSKINSGNAIVYALDLQSASADRPIHVSVYATYASTYSNRVNRFGLFVKKDETQTKITAVHEDPADISSNLKRRVAEDLQHNIFLDFTHSTANQDVRASMKTRIGVSRAELIALRNSPILGLCSQEDAAIDFKCQQLREQTEQISFGNISLHYSNDAKFIENMIVKYVSAAKVLIQGTEEKSGEGQNTVTMLFDVDQKTRSVDVFVTTPVTSAKVHRLALSKLPLSTVVEWATQPDAVSEYCGVSPNRFRTFDGGESHYKMDGGWHLVLHDRSRKYGISVLAQKSSNNTMKIEVNKDDQVMLRVEEGPKVYVNDKLQPLDVDHSVMMIADGRGRVMMHVIYTPDASVHIQLPNDYLDLKYTSASLVARAGPALQGRLCGMCGAYSNTGAEQFLTSDGRAAGSAAEFAASFQLPGDHSRMADTDSVTVKQ